MSEQRTAVGCLESHADRVVEMMGGYPPIIREIGDYLVIASIDQDEPTLDWWPISELEAAWITANQGRQADIDNGLTELDPISNYLWEELQRAGKNDAKEN